MTDNDVAAEITALEERFLDAQQFGDGKPLDIDKIMTFYALDCVLYDVVPPLQFIGHEAIRKDVAKLFGELKSLRIHLRELTVHGAGQLAVARCILELTTVGATGVVSRMTCRITDCWQRREGQWQLIHQHASMPGNLRTGTIQFNDKTDSQFTS